MIRPQWGKQHKIPCHQTSRDHHGGDNLKGFRPEGPQTWSPLAGEPLTLPGNHVPGNACTRPVARWLNTCPGFMPH